MKYDFDRMVDRHGTFCTEYDWTDVMNEEYGLGKLPENSIPIDIADMDFQCAPCIKDALQQVVDHNLYGYCSLHPSMAPEYYNGIIDWNRGRYGWEIKPEEIFYSPGTLAAITTVLKALTERNDSVLLLTPVYTPFYHTVRKIERNVVKSHLVNTDGYYTVDWDSFEKAASLPETKAFLLCSPHNPVGRVWTEAELRKMHEICTRNGVLVIADEIHGDLTRREAIFHPISKLVSGKNVVVCSGANKSFNIAGLHASHIVVQDPELRKKVKDEVGMVSPTPFVIRAVEAAYNEGEEWLEQLRDYLDGNIDAAIAFLTEHMPQVKVWRPEGTYMLWMDFSAYGLSDDELLDRCYRKAAVWIEQGRDFDEGGSPGFIRIVTSTQRSRLLEALERISRQF